MTQPILYTVGIQPLDIVSKRYTVVDILNTVTSTPNLFQLRPALLKAVSELKLGKDDYLLVNSRYGRGLLPYCHYAHTFIFDPSYSPQKKEVSNLFTALGHYISEENPLSNYQTSLNSARATLNLRMSNSTLLSAGLFNAMSLLTDLNGCNFGQFEKYIQNIPADSKSYSKFAIFLGDPVDLSFFTYLESVGIKPIAFLPYAYFTQPVTDLTDFYFTSPLFQPPLATLIELRRLVSLYSMDQGTVKGVTISHLIMNPRGLYLTQDEAAYYSANMPELEQYILPDQFSNLTLGL